MRTLNTCFCAAMALFSLQCFAQEATVFTQEANRAVSSLLPIADQQDWENARRGFMGTRSNSEIKDADGKIVWSLSRFDFLSEEPAASVNPSLWRQGQLNRLHGLFKVVDGIYQVRGFDLSVMTVIEGDTGRIVVDPLISKETAAAGMDLVKKHLGDRPVKAILYTHSHADHFGGVRGVVSEQEVVSGNVQVIAPQGFLAAAVNENVIAGNAMTRRVTYMFGSLLPKNNTGDIGTGLGQSVSSGSVGLIAPTHEITHTGETLTIDGVEFVFQLTPDAEAPAEFMFYLPRFKALCQAEEVNHTLHNLYTLRGAKVRDGLLWSKHIDQALQLFGAKADLSFGSHHWPTWGKDNVIDLLEKQRDLYRYIHDQTLRLANHGYTMNEIAEMIELPPSLASQFANRGYYGTVSHNVKAQYQLYLGWFDGNPANLNPLPPAAAGKKYVEFMGGAEQVLEKARESYKNGEYRWVATVVNHLVFAEPDNADARSLLADAYRQMGFMSESGPWRNFYLTGAQELMTGVLPLPAPRTLSPDLLRALPLDRFLDFLAVRLNGPKAAGRSLTFHVQFSDYGQQATLKLQNGVLNHRIGEEAGDADARVVIPASLLAAINMGQADFTEEMAAGRINIQGNQASFAAFLDLLDRFEFWFNIVTP